MKQRSFGFSASISLWVFAMRSPFRVESVSVLDRNEGFSYTFLVFGRSLRDEVTLTGRVFLRPRSERRLLAPSLRFWCWAFAMGSPVSGRVAYFCALDRNEGLFHPPILNCFAMGSPYGSSVVFLPTRSERSLWISGRCSFRMGSPFSGQVLTIWSRVKELLELGSWGRIFRAVLGVSFRYPLVDRFALKSGRVPIQLSSLLARTLFVPLSPTKEWVLALLLLVALLPLALPWWIGLLRRPCGDSFHLGVSCAGLTRMVAR